MEVNKNLLNREAIDVSVWFGKCYFCVDMAFSVSSNCPPYLFSSGVSGKPLCLRIIMRNADPEWNESQILVSYGLVFGPL